MALDTDRLAQAIYDNITNDVDSKYANASMGTIEPEPSEELEIFSYYVAKAIVNEFDANAQTEAGIATTDGAVTLESSDGIIK